MSRPFARAYENKSKMYDSARPFYPQEVIQFIRENLNLSLDLPVLDVGSGTGILTRQMAAIGMPMLGIEPDTQMVAKARTHKGEPKPNYHCGTAECLGVGSKTAAALVCGQSFHWFETDLARVEFQRVLATDNPVFLIWNIRSADHDEFHCAYEQLLKDVFKRYPETFHIDDALDGKIQQFFSGNHKEQTFKHVQKLCGKGLLEKTMSCSYAPQPRTREYRIARESLKALHRKYEQSNFISFQYDTRVVYGRI